MIFVAGFNLDGAGSNDLHLAYYGIIGKPNPGKAAFAVIE
jgi:hypothetical protein